MEPWGKTMRKPIELLFSWILLLLGETDINLKIFKSCRNVEVELLCKKSAWESLRGLSRVSGRSVGWVDVLGWHTLTVLAVSLAPWQQ